MVAAPEFPSSDKRAAREPMTSRRSWSTLESSRTWSRTNSGRLSQPNTLTQTQPISLFTVKQNPVKQMLQEWNFYQTFPVNDGMKPSQSLLEITCYERAPQQSCVKPTQLGSDQVVPTGNQLSSSQDQETYEAASNQNNQEGSQFRPLKGIENPNISTGVTTPQPDCINLPMMTKSKLLHEVPIDLSSKAVGRIHVDEVLNGQDKSNMCMNQAVMQSYDASFANDTVIERRPLDFWLPEWARISFRQIEKEQKLKKVVNLGRDDKNKAQDGFVLPPFSYIGGIAEQQVHAVYEGTMNVLPASQSVPPKPIHSGINMNLTMLSKQEEWMDKNGWYGRDIKKVNKLERIVMKLHSKVKGESQKVSLNDSLLETNKSADTIGTMAKLSRGVKELPTGKKLSLLERVKMTMVKSDGKEMENQESAGAKILPLNKNGKLHMDPLISNDSQNNVIKRKKTDGAGNESKAKISKFSNKKNTIPSNETVSGELEVDGINKKLPKKKPGKRKSLGSTRTQKTTSDGQLLPRCFLCIGNVPPVAPSPVSTVKIGDVVNGEVVQPCMIGYTNRTPPTLADDFKPTHWFFS